MAIKNKNFLFFGLAFFTIILDQLIKYLVKANLAVSESVPVIKNIFHLTLIKNFGIGFGMLNTPSARWILVFISLIIIGVILYYYDNDGIDSLKLLFKADALFLGDDFSIEIHNLLIEGETIKLTNRIKEEKNNGE